jgi:hypothetical protein
MRLNNDIKRWQSPGEEAVKKLRRQTLGKGMPFMINSSDLPSRQCYLEQPDGSIFLVQVPEAQNPHFTPIRQLNDIETGVIRNKFHLY